MKREVSVLIVPVKRHCRKEVTAAPFGKSREVVINQPGFNTDVYKNGQAVKLTHHDGEIRSGIIGESSKDYISVFVVDKLGLAKKVEIDLEDYINGVWAIKLL